MSDLTKYAKGRRMPFEEKNKQITKNTEDIEALKEKVQTDLPAMYEVSNVTSIASATVNKFKAGDIVIEKSSNNYTAYNVVYKTSSDLTLTTANGEKVKSHNYHKSGTTWSRQSSYDTDIRNTVKFYTGASLTAEIVGLMQLGDVFRPTGGAGIESYTFTLVKYEEGDDNDDFKVFARYEDTVDNKELGQISYIKWKNPYEDEHYTGWEYYDSFEYKLGGEKKYLHRLQLNLTITTSGYESVRTNNRAVVNIVDTNPSPVSGTTQINNLLAKNTSDLQIILAIKRTSDSAIGYVISYYTGITSLNDTISTTCNFPDGTSQTLSITLSSGADTVIEL